MHLKIPLILKQIIGILIVTLITFNGSSQTVTVNNPPTNLPKAFSTLGDSTSINIIELSELFSKKNNEKVILTLGSQFFLEGVVQSISDNNTVTTISIKLSTPSPLLLTFSKIILAQDSIIYRGLISGRNTGDCLELIKDKNQFKFIKKEINYLRAE